MNIHISHIYIYIIYFLHYIQVSRDLSMVSVLAVQFSVVTVRISTLSREAEALTHRSSQEALGKEGRTCTVVLVGLHVKPYHLLHAKVPRLPILSI